MLRPAFSRPTFAFSPSASVSRSVAAASAYSIRRPFSRPIQLPVRFYDSSVLSFRYNVEPQGRPRKSKNFIKPNTPADPNWARRVQLEDSLSRVANNIDLQRLMPTFLEFQRKAQLDSRIYRAMIGAHLRMKQPIIAEQYFTAMQSAGFPADEALYMQMIECCCSMSLTQQAIKFFEKARAEFTIPRISSYEKLLRACITGHHFPECISYFKKFREEKVQLTADMYLCAIQAHIKLDQPQDAENLLMELQTDKLTPELEHIHPILAHAVKTNNDETFRRLLDVVRDAQILPDIALLKTAVTYYTRGSRWSDVLHQWHRLRSMNPLLLPSVELYEHAIVAAFNVDLVDDALAIFDDFKANVESDAHQKVVSLMIAQLAHKDRINEAEQIREEFRSHIAPAPAAMKQLLEAYKARGETAKGLALFDTVLEDQQHTKQLVLTAHHMAAILHDIPRMMKYLEILSTTPGYDWAPTKLHIKMLIRSAVHRGTQQETLQLINDASFIHQKMKWFAPEFMERLEKEQANPHLGSVVTYEATLQEIGGELAETETEDPSNTSEGERTLTLKWEDGDELTSRRNRSE